MSVRAGGKPEYILKISHGWFKWLMNSVIEAFCNEKDFQK